MTSRIGNSISLVACSRQSHVDGTKCVCGRQIRVVFCCAPRDVSYYNVLSFVRFRISHRGRERETESYVCETVEPFPMTFSRIFPGLLNRLYSSSRCTTLRSTSQQRNQNSTVVNYQSKSDLIRSREYLSLLFSFRANLRVTTTRDGEMRNILYTLTHTGYRERNISLHKIL